MFDEFDEDNWNVIKVLTNLCLCMIALELYTHYFAQQLLGAPIHGAIFNCCKIIRSNPYLSILMLTVLPEFPSKSEALLIYAKTNLIMCFK